jgi:hypothetical protein
LLSAERFDGLIWEPACGQGAICRVLEAAGYTVISSDLVDRGYGEGRTDFLLEFKPRAPNIVTNPPFKLGEAFAEKALALTTGKVAMLMRLSWLASQERYSLFRKWPPRRVLVFSKRLPMMHRLDWNGPRSTSTIDFAWFVWEHGYAGATVIDWFPPSAVKPPARTARARHKPAAEPGPLLPIL